MKVSPWYPFLIITIRYNINIYLPWAISEVITDSWKIRGQGLTWEMNKHSQENNLLRILHSTTSELFD